MTLEILASYFLLQDYELKYSESSLNNEPKLAERDAFTLK